MADEFLVRFDANTPVIRQDLQLAVNNLLQDIRQRDARQFLEVLNAHGTFGQLVWLAVDLHLNLVVMVVVFMFMPVMLFSRALLRFWRVFMLLHNIKPRLLRAVLAGSSSVVSNMVS